MSSKRILTLLWRRSVSVLTLLLGFAAPLVTACGDAVDPSSSVPQETFLRFESDPGDFVGQGQSHQFTAADGTWYVHTEPDATGTAVNQVSFFAHDDVWNFYLDFAAVSGEALAVGTYENAQKFNSLTQPNLDFGFTGRGCSEVTGSFVVRYLKNRGRAVDGVHATFEQHCEGAVAGLRGEISSVR